MRGLIIFSIFLFGIAPLVQGQDDSVVTIPELGRIRGVTGTSYEDLNGNRRQFFNYRGVPYGNFTKRFEPSFLVERDFGEGEIYNATMTPRSCYQPLLPDDPFFLTEDCLTLNIWTHQLDNGNDSALRPVIFFIHGGAFTVGNGPTFSGMRIMTKDVVYVSFNYRLGLFGFFSLQNEAVPGNAAMYDVVNALKWTNKYIKYFGGDPNLVTIAGQSAGAVTVTELMASNMARQYFHRAIAASGSALNAWGTATNPIDESLRIANKTGCYDMSVPPNLPAITDCMQNQVNASHLVTTLWNYQIAERNAGRLGFAVVSPVVQDFPMTQEKFLPEHPKQIFQESRQADVPLMMSCTKHDGSYVLGVFYNRFLKDNDLINNSTFIRNELVSSVLLALGIEDSPLGLHDTIARTYLGDDRLSGDFMQMYPGLIDVFSVFFFKSDTYQTALYHSTTNDTFWSSFEYRGEASFWGQLFPGGETPPFPGGITHTDDLIYTHTLTFLPFNREEMEVQERMINYWVDFARTGRPSPDWQPLTKETESYMVINSVSENASAYTESWVGPGYEAPRPITTPTPPTEPPTTTPPSPTEAIVTIPELGTIRGITGESYEDVNGDRRRFLNFRGIPYGNFTKRFEPSFLVERDFGEGEIYNATMTPRSCYQPLLPDDPFFLTEDCLTLNIWTHQLDNGNDSALRPVIFFIHGGAFTVGNGPTFSGMRIMTKDVVYVSFNYRLGLFGFFSLQNEAVPGNAAMYDVVNALKWTNKYIKYFGGDPNLVTIAGQSAGAVTVTQLMASNMARQYFHRAIAASGSALNAWGTATNPIDESLRIANKTGCYDMSVPPNLPAITDCMQNQVNASHLVKTLWDYQIAERNAGRLGFAVVSPVVQDFPMTQEKFLPEHPKQIFQESRQANVPLMMSCTKHDGSYVLGVFYNRFLKDNDLINNSTFIRNELVSSVLLALGIEDYPLGLHDTIARTYLGDSRLSGDFMEMYPGLIDVFSVFFFKSDTYQTALYHSNTNDTFWSSFEYRGEASFWGQLFPGGETPPFPGGITHTDDLIYTHTLTFLPFNREEMEVSERMINYWVDFARTGRPSLDWQPLTKETESYMVINSVSENASAYTESWVGPGYEAPRPITTTMPPTVTPTRITTTTTAGLNTTTAPGVTTPPPVTESSSTSTSEETTPDPNVSSEFKSWTLLTIFAFSLINRFM